jgi:hypothetical protein|tara:strand:- start:113 stop:334 length:222 start_codon:yes stop_codon:yes gene_type:complete
MSAGKVVDLIWAMALSAAEIHVGKTGVRVVRLEARATTAIQKQNATVLNVHILLELIVVVRLVHALCHMVRVV